MPEERAGQGHGRETDESRSQGGDLFADRTSPYQRLEKAPVAVAVIFGLSLLGILWGWGGIATNPPSVRTYAAGFGLLGVFVAVVPMVYDLWGLHRDVGGLSTGYWAFLGVGAPILVVPLYLWLRWRAILGARGDSA